MKETSIDLNELYRLYVVEKKTARECATLMNKSTSTIGACLKRNGWSRPRDFKRDEYGRFIREGQELPPQELHNNPAFKSGKEAYRRIAEIYRLPKFCFHCKKTHNLHIHHIDEDRENNDPSNLRWVCNSCHQKIEHAHKKRDKYGRFI
ncbi:HNH endonuclease signature motif containing protein [Sutcliffiella horikoshii]|uniref:HNH endonuclease signature motif containing protein n=1 Tax=Sutcliffiella horikoshii TaxID=79883 RepID=UPI003CE8C7BC